MPCTEWPSQTGSTLAFYLANCSEGRCEMNMLCCDLSLQEVGTINHLMQCVCVLCAVFECL